MASAFFDTNVLLYLLSADAAKANRAEELLGAGGCLSVQVLNEFASVAHRKLRMTWGEIEEALATIRAVCDVVPLTVETHERALALAVRHRIEFYDALIIAAALLAGCETLYTEDLQAGAKIERRLAIRNPF